MRGRAANQSCGTERYEQLIHQYYRRDFLALPTMAAMAGQGSPSVTIQTLMAG